MPPFLTRGGREAEIAMNTAAGGVVSILTRYSMRSISSRNLAARLSDIFMAGFT